VVERNFDDYEPTRMRELPEVEVHIVGSQESPSGIAEPGVRSWRRPFCNAIFAATGKLVETLA
jgi:isoquinoline 1-oxidoreductase subunit beta